MVQLDRFGDEAPARRSSRDETSSSLQGRASRLQQRVTVLEVDLAQAQSQISSLKQQLARERAAVAAARAEANSSDATAERAVNLLHQTRIEANGVQMRLDGTIIRSPMTRLRSFVGTAGGRSTRA